MGAVYLALRQPVGLRTALKVLHGRFAEGGALAARFLGEAEALARLVHPNIVRLLGAGTAQDRTYIAMEFIEGGRTLADAMAEGVDLDAARRILLQMIDALDSAHRAHVIHRDIKPANVMLQPTGREPYFVRIVDFGLVKFTDDGASTELLAGTPVYMAPEQVRRADIGPPTDWYATGVVACELLTGRRPFPAMQGHALLRLKLTGELDPLAGSNAESLPPPVRALIARTLAHDPRDRPQSAAEMAALVEGACAALVARGRTGPPSGAPTVETTSGQWQGAIDGSGPLPARAPLGRRARIASALAAAGLLTLAVAWWHASDGDGPGRRVDAGQPAPAKTTLTPTAGEAGPAAPDARHDAAAGRPDAMPDGSSAVEAPPDAAPEDAAAPAPAASGARRRRRAPPPPPPVVQPPATPTPGPPTSPARPGRLVIEEL